MYQTKWRTLYIMLYITATEATDKKIGKDQYCTDPRTMKQHAAYSEWTDAYSCTRHRCQPGGQDLAIFTVGCKRVEAPESAIQCEEVVEDTNIQFPYCCTRLRCLVVVHGEVWTRVIGQPWEILPAAPWSHMYKKKKPPPGSPGFLTKSIMEVPGHQITEEVAEPVVNEDVKTRTSSCNGHHDALRSSIASPDIVIALTTGDEEPESKNPIEDMQPQRTENLADSKEELGKVEKEIEDQNDVPVVKAQESRDPEEKSELNLQTLVDAIGLRMRDIEDVVQKMSQKVEEGKKNLFRDEQEIENERNNIEEPPSELPAEEAVTISYYNDPSNVISHQKFVKEPTQYIAPIEPHNHKSPDKKKRRRKKNRAGRKNKRREVKKKRTDNAIKDVDSAVLSIEDYNNKYV